MSILSAYEQLDNAWKRAEDALRAYHCPVPVRVPAEPDSEEGASLFLSWTKTKQRWRICLEDASGLDVTPITECSVIDRMEAINYFSVLREAVSDTVKRLTPEVEDASIALNQIISTST